MSNLAWAIAYRIIVSTQIMESIWDTLPKKGQLKPTCLQIRFLGAKGMISLDSRLPGEVLALRQSMIKFDAPGSSTDIEICESAVKPLPMYLNRQFIKILEDMGVEESYFLNLQATEVRRLRMVADNPLNASNFLTRQSIGETVHLPWLITELAMLNLDFRSDGFLRDTVELALLAELRKLKHKTRIPVEKGWHLHGLMDETEYLEEGQIFCSVIVDGVPNCLVGKDLIVSRAPALHPGDCTCKLLFPWFHSQFLVVGRTLHLLFAPPCMLTCNSGRRSYATRRLPTAKATQLHMLQPKGFTRSAKSTQRW